MSALVAIGADLGNAFVRRRYEHQRKRSAASRLVVAAPLGEPGRDRAGLAAALHAGVIPEDKIASPAQIGATAWELAADGTLGDGHARLGAARAGRLRRRRRDRRSCSPCVAGLSRIGEDAVDPPMQMLRTLPHFGLIPLFIVWMGIGEAPKIALIAMGVAFPLYLNTFSGIRSIDRKMTRGRRDDGADPAPAAAARRRTRRTAAGARRSPAEPRASPGSR